MPLAAIPAAVWAATATGAATVGAGAIGAHGQTEAAKTQADAAKQGSADQLKAAEEGLAFQKQQYANTLKAVAPYQNMGAGALAALGSGLGVTPGNIAPPPLSLGSAGIQNPTRNPDGSTSGFVAPGDLAAYQGQPQGMPNLTPNQQAIDSRTQAANSAQSLSQSSVAAQPGEVRMINGQQAKWDGKGWEAV
jgi:hypothetical protein